MFNSSRFSVNLAAFFWLLSSPALSTPTGGVGGGVALAAGYTIVSKPIQSGTEIAINGKHLPVNWLEWQDSRIPDRLAIGISDLGLMHSMGVELLDTDNHQQQPISWFAFSHNVPTQYQSGYRYLEISELAARENWQIQIQGNRLEIVTPPSTIESVQADFIADNLCVPVAGACRGGCNISHGKNQPTPHTRPSDPVLSGADFGIPPYTVALASLGETTGDRTDGRVQELSDLPTTTLVNPPGRNSENFCRRFVVRLNNPANWQTPSIIGRSISPQNLDISDLPPPLQELLKPPSPQPEPEPEPTEETNLEDEGDRQPLPTPPRELPPLVWWSIPLEATSPHLSNSSGSRQLPGSVILPGNNIESLTPSESSSDLWTNLMGLWVDSQNQQTRLIFSTPTGWQPVVTSSAVLPEINIEIRPDFWRDRNIVWAEGLRWQQKYIDLNSHQRLFTPPPSNSTGRESARFPVVWLEIDLNNQGISLQPILSRPGSRSGVSPLVHVASSTRAAAAINGGFFNRNNQYPLGAIRHQNRWLSGPILNRGAIAWTDQNQFFIDRLELSQTLFRDRREPIPLARLNSAFIQRGLSRYTSDWGSTYSPFTPREIAITVQGETIISHQVLDSINFSAVPIPDDGYLLILRNEPEIALALGIDETQCIGLVCPPSTQTEHQPLPVQLVDETNPPDFAEYPHILGAGPLLLRGNQVVLDARAENFSDAFNTQRAIRSAVGLKTNTPGRSGSDSPAVSLLLVVVHPRLGGPGPSLAELAELMKQLGATDALNLDGGSSTGLYLGGYLLDRPPQTAAPIHNALGVFLSP
ncbi:phosphodiester glycosidase family protein [Arthrospira platensis FACHB-439]|uniref:phosphodiester glycosidase family protein n=1 Tax=Limnospira platensis TaxID=118562 RepID=UPI001686A75B|nr:phosphodiester glycosidase family protein [Arthrospira platensis FACHB-439]